MIVQHLLALYLIVIAPIWDHFAIRKLRSGTDPRRKIKFYWLVIAATWTATAVACQTVGWQSIFWIHPDSRDISWLPSGTGANSFMVGLLVAFAAGALAPAILMKRSPRYAASIEKAMKPLQFILPATGQERGWWVAICATAGIGEEILYRGFLIQYFRHEPLHLNLIPAVLLACVIFGIAHLYQGVKGIAGTAFLGLVFSAIFVIAGNLLTPMILHFLIDLRILLLLPAESKMNLESA
jgi:membrane protease YdiL (CAAX protease family)